MHVAPAPAPYLRSAQAPDWYRVGFRLDGSAPLSACLLGPGGRVSLNF